MIAKFGDPLKDHHWWFTRMIVEIIAKRSPKDREKDREKDLENKLKK